MKELELWLIEFIKLIEDERQPIEIDKYKLLSYLDKELKKVASKSYFEFYNTIEGGV